MIAMRLLRVVLALLLAASIAASPAMAGMALSKSAKAEMSMGSSADHCPCCDKTKKCPADHCMLQCYDVPAIVSATIVLQRSLHHTFARVDAVAPSPFPPRPDPPPPRS